MPLTVAATKMAPDPMKVVYDKHKQMAGTDNLKSNEMKPKQK